MFWLKKIILLIFISILSSCKTSTSHLINDNRNFSSYDSSWIFFNLENKIEVKVVDHIKNDAHCGIVAVASVTFVIDEREEIFRVLNLCNLTDYKKDELIRLNPTDKPDFNVSLPYRVFLNPQTNKRERFELDKNTLKTTYAHIEKIPQ